jgi:hypothetical protein
MGALLAVLEHVPQCWYGDKARLRVSRHSVLVAMAKYANRDGENVWASVARIAHTACVAPSTAHAAIKFFVRTGRLKERAEPHPQYGTKIYDLVMPTREDAEEAQRERSQALEKDRASTRQRVAKFREKATCNGNERVTETAGVTPETVLRNGDERVTVTPGSALCNAGISVDLSFDLPEKHLSNNNNPEAAADVATPLEIKPKAQPTATATSEFLTALRKSYEAHGPFNSTAAHRNAALEMAAECGRDVFLSAFDLWVSLEPRETFNVRVKGEAGEANEEFIRWPLHKFINEGYALKYIEMARPYAGIATGETLRFLCEQQAGDETPITIGQERAARLAELIEKFGYFDVSEACDGADDVCTFLDKPMHYIQLKKNKRQALAATR